MDAVLSSIIEFRVLLGEIIRSTINVRMVNVNNEPPKGLFVCYLQVSDCNPYKTDILSSAMNRAG